MGLLRGAGGGLDDARSVRAAELAVVAEAVRTSVGTALRDEQLAVGILLCDQLEGRRPYRSGRSLTRLNLLLGTPQDRSLAAALPVFLYARQGVDVHVMTATESRARKDADLYDAIDRELGGLAELGVGLLRADQRRAEREVAFRRRITVGVPGQFDKDVVARGVAMLRVPHYGSFVERRYPKVAQLPELASVA